MTDHVTPRKRSDIMSRIRGKNTTPELIVRKLVYSLGYRYRLHGKNLPGKPDLVFAGRQKVIFVHGCFWHFHNCKKGKLPKSNIEYWQPKLEENRRRDSRNYDALTDLNWKYLVIWQCQLKDMDSVKDTISSFFDAS